MYKNLELERKSRIQLFWDRTKKFYKLGLSIFLVIAACEAQAMLIEWGGTYRAEWINVGSTSLGSPKNDKSYILNSLMLRPKIVASDGFTVMGELNLLPNSSYADAQTGQLLGQSPTQSRAVDGNTQGSADITIRQLYMNYNQEYASLIVGRAPVEFGLGMTHNPGTGAFDHFGDTLDQVTYKFLVNNWSFAPMFGKRKKLDPGTGGEVSELNFVLDYKSPETKSEFGVFQQTRKASVSVNDAPAYSNSNPYGYGKAVTGQSHVTDGEWSTQNTNVYLTRGFETWSIQLEAGFESGDVGVSNAATQEKVTLGGFGILLNLDFGKPEDSSTWNVKLGYASGDDASTIKYEGFAFDKNMDVALLMFNHPLGQYDVLRSGVRRTPATATTVLANGKALDDEVITNAIFVSPTWSKAISDKWKITNRLTWAQLAVDPNPGNGISKDLGIEYDFGFHFSPKKEILWSTELALLSPGAAFAGGTAGFEKSFTYGLMSRFSISF